MKKTIILIFLTSIIGCALTKKILYVDSIDLSFMIQQLDGNNNYRIYLNKGFSDSCTNYIDVCYNSTDMPCMTLYFPHGNSDTIYIREDSGKVIQFQSPEFKIVIPSKTGVDSISDINKIFYLDDRKHVYYLTDSSKAKIPCIKIRFNPNMTGINVYDEKDRFKYECQ